MSGYINGSVNDPASGIVVDTVKTKEETDTTLESVITQDSLVATNNYPLSEPDEVIVDDTPEDPVEDTGDVNTGDTDTDDTDTVTETVDDSLGILETFETIYQNLKSLPYDGNVVNSLYVTRTYTKNDGSTIVVERDGSVENLLVIKISGNTGFDNTLVKTIQMQEDIRLAATYGVE